MKSMNTSPIGANKMRVRRIQREIFLCDLNMVDALVVKVALLSFGVAFDTRYWLPPREALISTSDDRGCCGIEGGLGQ